MLFDGIESLSLLTTLFLTHLWATPAFAGSTYLAFSSGSPALPLLTCVFLQLNRFAAGSSNWSTRSPYFDYSSTLTYLKFLFPHL